MSLCLSDANIEINFLFKNTYVADSELEINLIFIDFFLSNNQ